MAAVIVIPDIEEPTWTAREHEGDTVYTRPLLGSELFVYKVSHVANGKGDPCFGITFSSKFSSIELSYKLVQALARLRFLSPLLAATIQPGYVQEDPSVFSWVYRPIHSGAKAEAWALETLELVQGYTDAEAFLQDRTQRRLPYTHRDGSTQYFRCFLVLLGHDEYALFAHGTHAILDAHPNLKLFSLLFQYVNQGLLDFNDLPWGEEWQNLPAGPVVATGGPRDGWSQQGAELLGRIQSAMTNPVPTHALRPMAREVTKPGLDARVLVVLDEDVSARIVKNLKAKGYTATHLADAALAIAVFAHNPDIEVDEDAAHFTSDYGLVSLVKDMIPPHNEPTRIVSALAMLPVTTPYAVVKRSEDKFTQLCIVMDHVKAIYDSYMSNPHLPRFTSFVSMNKSMRDAPYTGHPHPIIVTNIGVVERWLQTRWASSNGGDLAFEVHEIVFGHRWEDLQQVAHVWSMHNQIHLQIQANEAWDREYLQAFANHMVDIMKIMAY